MVFCFAHTRFCFSARAPPLAPLVRTKACTHARTRTHAPRMTRPRAPTERIRAAADALLADPVGAANQLPRLIEAEGVPSDEVRVREGEGERERRERGRRLVLPHVGGRNHPALPLSTGLFGGAVSKRTAWLWASSRGRTSPHTPFLSPNPNTQPSAATAAAAVRGAMLVFQAAGARGELEPATGNGEGDGEAAVDGDEEDAASGRAAEHAYRAWLRSRFADHTAALRLLLKRGGEWPALQATAARAALEAARTAQAGVLDVSSASAALDALLSSDRAGAGASDAAVAVFVATAAECVDVRYAVLRGVAAAAAGLARAAACDDADEDDDEDGPLADAGRTLVDVLTALPPTVDLGGGGGGGDASTAAPPKTFCGADALGGAAPSTGTAGARARRKRRRDGGDGDASTRRAPWASATRQRAAAGAAWAACLRAPLPTDAAARLLTALPAALPGVGTPLLLCDALFAAASSPDASRALAALRALFELVVRHGVEYPRAYDALYALVTPMALSGPRRADFAGLADAFLASPLVPAYTAAAFAKRYARLAATASLPPPVAEGALAMVHNVVRRHRACGVLLHRVDGDEKASASLHSDPYNPAAPDPASSRAIESSLWEVAQAARSPHARVAAAARALLENDPARRGGGEVDYSTCAAATYGSAVAAALAKRVKRQPGVAAPVGEDVVAVWGPAAGGAWGGWV